MGSSSSPSTSLRSPALSSPLSAPRNQLPLSPKHTAFARRDYQAAVLVVVVVVVVVVIVVVVLVLVLVLVVVVVVVIVVVVGSALVATASAVIFVRLI